MIADWYLVKLNHVLLLNHALLYKQIYYFDKFHFYLQLSSSFQFLLQIRKDAVIYSKNLLQQPGGAVCPPSSAQLRPYTMIESFLFDNNTF